MDEKILLIEKKNFLTQFLSLILGNMKNNVIFFQTYQHNDIKKDKLINSNLIKSLKINKKKQEELTFSANKIALAYLEEKFDLNSNKYFQFVYNFIPNKNFIIAYKKGILPYVQNKIRFYLLLQYYYQDQKYRDIKVIFCQSDTLELYKLLELDNNIISQIKKNNFYLNFFENLRSILNSIFYMPYWFIKKIIKNGVNFSEIKKKNYSIGQHVQGGFNIYTQNSEKFTNNRWDDLLFKNLKNANTNFTFIFSNWRFQNNELSKHKKHLEKNKISWIEEYENSIPASYLFRIVFFKYLRFLILSIKLVLEKNNNHQLNLLTQQIIRFIHENQIFCKHYNIEVFFGRDDYNVQHIVRTIIQNKFGLKQKSIHHSGFIEPYVATYLTYTYYDTYYISGGDYLKRIYQKYWFSKKHIVVGQPYFDYIMEYSQSKKNFQKFMNFFKFKKNILLVVPPISGTSMFDDEEDKIDKYKNICKLILNKKNTNLIIRARSLEDTQLLKKIIKICENRIYYITSEFNTYELIAHSNIIIGNDTSSALVEAIGLDDKFIIPYLVRFREKNSLIWDKYHYKSIARDLDDLLYLTEKDINEFLESRKNIKGGFCYPSDGKTWFRIAKNIMQ